MRIVPILAASAVALFTALGSAPGAGAQAPPRTPRSARSTRVVLIRPAEKVAWSDEMLTRASGELRAAGFEPTVVDATPGEDVRATLRRADPTAIAVISIAPNAAEVWVEDRLTGKISIRPLRAADDSYRAASDLAIEAVELLRASLIELTVLPRAALAATEAPRAAVAFAEAARPAQPPKRGPFRAAVGPTLLAGFDPAAVMVAPAFAVGFISEVGLGGRVRFIGPGAGADLDVSGGTVSWTPWILSAGATYEAFLSSSWFIRGSLDGGLFHLSARGDLAPPARSREGTALDAAFLGGGALGFALNDHLSIQLGLEALVVAPPATVVVGGETIATAGRPWLVLPLVLELSQ